MFSIVPARRSRAFDYTPFALDRFFNEPFTRLLDSSPMEKSDWSPAVEAYESENDIIFKLEVPGLDKKDVNIHVENGILSFSGERSRESGDERDYFRSERWYGKFCRSFRLPDTADPEKIDAQLQEGVLTVTVPKKEAAKPRQVKVRVS